MPTKELPISFFSGTAPGYSQGTLDILYSRIYGHLCPYPLYCQEWRKGRGGGGGGHARSPVFSCSEAAYTAILKDLVESKMGGGGRVPSVSLCGSAFAS